MKQHRKQKSSSQSGFSILEVLIGAAILAVCSAIAASNFSQNAVLRKHDLSQSMMGKELDPLMRTYFANHLIPKIKSKVCKLKQADLRYDQISSPTSKSLIIRPWSNAPAAIVSSLSDPCSSITSTSSLDSTKISGCIKVGNLKSFPSLNAKDGNKKNLFNYVQFEITFKDMLEKPGSGSAIPTCGDFRNPNSPMAMEVFYTAHWIESASASTKNMVKYSNTINLNNR